MSNYVKSTNFASKDSLATGNPLKIVKGTEIDTEFNNIATAVATKADLNSPALIGTPTAPTASAGTNTTQIATTAFTTSAITAERTATATLTNKTLTSPTITGASVNITSGTITGITDLAIADGGTGASTAANAFNNLKQAATTSATGVVELATTAEAEAGTDTSRAVTPAGVEAHMNANGFGVNQTWQSVTRTSSTWYQNTTGKPIMFFARWNIFESSVTFYVNATTASTSGATSIDFTDGDSGDSGDYGIIVIPPNHYYMCDNVGVARELR